MDRICIEQKTEILGTPEQVFKHLTGDVSDWWDHSFSDGPSRIHLEPKLGGRFFEEFANDNGGALYATVIYVDAPQKIVLQGPWGFPKVPTDLTVWIYRSQKDLPNSRSLRGKSETERPLVPRVLFGSETSGLDWRI